MNSQSIRREGGLIKDYINFAGHLQGTSKLKPNQEIEEGESQKRSPLD